MHSFKPSELLYPKSLRKLVEEKIRFSDYKYPLDEWIFTLDYTTEKLLKHFQVKNLKGYGIDDLDTAKIAAGAILHYLEETENKNVQHIQKIERIHSDQYVWMDKFTIRNLELLQTVHEGGLSLRDVLDQTISPMGARKLQKWIMLPLKNIKEIKKRSNIVGHYLIEQDQTTQLRKDFKKLGDLERICSRLAMGKIHPREVYQLKVALEGLASIKKSLHQSNNSYLESIASQIDECTNAAKLIESSIVENPPTLIQKGGVIKESYNDELDDLRNTANNSKDILLDIQKSEAANTGISNLKIGFNNVFGYYLEVTNKYKNQGLVPETWVRKQTLTGSERYITDELKKLEQKILSAEERIQGLEEKLYAEIVQKLQKYIPEIQNNAHHIAALDCLISFSLVAYKNNYCEATIHQGTSVTIKNGRHPVIEQQLEPGNSYTANDLFLDNESQQIIMLTGPNMSGKSAFLRQSALICIMAQMGSYVPAESAEIGILDKIFSRVGASDNISSGESTFMVEMNETASIVNNISDRSLVLLDEIGRGTSTYDGISIAWSLAEFLHNNKEFRAKTLFATHYHELNELANSYDRIKNYNVAIKEVGQKILFLHKVVEGGSQHSFGIHVAKMAGLPKSIIVRAIQILKHLEEKSIDGNKQALPDSISPETSQIDLDPVQLSIFETVDPTAGKIREILTSLDLNSMTPIECMLKLNEMVKLIEENEET